MKYISRSPAGIFDLIEYEAYLERDREALATHIHGDDLLTIDRFVPVGRESLHDSRFDSLLVATSGSDGGLAARILSVELRLKGPYFDRYFEFRYEDAVSCNFEAPKPDDDLLMHELRREDGAMTHELHFDRGSTIAITCRKLRFVERIGGC